MENKGYPVSIVYPIEGTMLNVDGIALVKMHTLILSVKVSAIFNKPLSTTTISCRVRCQVNSKGC